jgi:pimeloyl-ACP methyl ester carboxylesterase
LRRRFSILLVSGWLLSLLIGGGGPAQASTPLCQDVYLPVRLAEEQPARERVFGRLCTPPGATPRTVQFLVHGLTYDHTYWDLPGDGYSYVNAMVDAGYATFAIDRIGVGRSSHPFGLAVTVESNAFVMHQVVQALRAGRIGSTPYQKVVLVGHSYGSWASWYEASDFQDVDAVLLSGVSHKLSVSAPLRALFQPATLDPRFTGLDATYLTTLPGAREWMFHHPSTVEPALLEYDENHKQTVTVGEIQNFVEILTRPLDLRVPTLLVNGTGDGLFCGPGIPLGVTDCSSNEALLASESPHLGDHVPSLEAQVIPGVGHDLTYATKAPEFFSVAREWADRVTRHRSEPSN